MKTKLKKNKTPFCGIKIHYMYKDENNRIQGQRFIIYSSDVGGIGLLRFRNDEYNGICLRVK